MSLKERYIQFNEVGLKHWTLQFEDNAVEQEYRDEYFTKSIVSFRISAIIVTLLYALFGFLDFYTAPDFKSEFLLIRLGIILPLMTVTWLLSFTKNYRRYWQTLISACFLIGGLGITYMLLRNPSNIFYYGGLFLIFMAGYFFINLLFIYAIVPGICIIVFYNFAPLFSNTLNHLSAEYLIVTNTFFISANLIAIVALYNSKFIERNEFLQRRLLSKQQGEIKRINEGLEEKVLERTKMLENQNKNLITAKQKAEENDRLKSAFLSNMSHEIRTPMNGIIGFLDLMNDPGISKEEQQQYIDIVKQSGNRLLETINDIIEISKIEAGQLTMHFSDIDLRQTFQYLFDFFSREAKTKGIELIVPKLENSFIINTDSHKLQSIFTNLIKNAIKFTNTGSIEIGFEPNNEQLRFFVKDTGIGIPKEKFAAIFDRFVQADVQLSRGYEGTGLGLSICKAYAESLGGSIWVESEIRKGTTFYFTIDGKISDLTKNRAEEGKVTASGLPDKKTKALVAEDDDVSFDLIKTLLEGENIKVKRARNGREAFEYFQENKNSLSLIFMDIKMPVLDGIEATKKIRETDSKIPIIAQTAFALSGDKELALKAGCSDYISKPIQKQELLASLKRNLQLS